MKKILISLIALGIVLNLQAEQECDAIITITDYQILCTITSIGANEIQYRYCPNGDKIERISIPAVKKIHMSNGVVIDYTNTANQTTTQIAKEQTVSDDAPRNHTLGYSNSVAYNNPQRIEADYARVERVNGVFVFTDCSPLAFYEVVGEVSVTGLYNSEIQYAGGQYQTVRDELVKTAKAANGQVEGVILTLVRGGVDKAHLIRFTDYSEDHSLARVRRYSGIYVFCDCSPLAKYEYIGNLNGKFTFTPQYSTLRDDFIKKCRGKYKKANGMIIHLVTGGKDSAEAIQLY